ncbi:cytochrome P450 [Paraburkholderia tropica]|uniref:cytochrome P450 n=1 Tax=Paraburkholderia tropica TaxID=92647 RepID=UPI0007ED65B2|nr:cytochrome P450 [Paraburkholderia tropica]OBR54067.1 hypothetical protein A6456_22350 [Paraburkholderia tropica]
MQEPTIFSALKEGFRDPLIYYTKLRRLGGGQGVFFDRYVGGHVVTGYEECREVARRVDEFGRRPLSLPADFFKDNKHATAGYKVMQAMSIFLPAGPSYSARRQRLLETFGHIKHQSVLDHVRETALCLVQQLPVVEPTEVFLGSLRPFAARCASLLVLKTGSVPDCVTEDAVTATFFFDGKRPQKEHLASAMCATDRLADWLATQLDMSRSNDAELLSDFVLLYIAAHESVAYLLYTCLRHLSTKSDGIQNALTQSAFASIVSEAIRYDSPVQMSGRVALEDVCLGKYVIRKGEHVYLHVGSANRDDKTFTRADEFDENRQARHLGFGWGPTRCVGAEFAAACATEFLTAVSARFSSLHYHAGETRFDHGLSARGLKAASFSLIP